MKNSLITLMITALIFIFTACGGGGSGSGSDAPAEAVMTTSTDAISWTFAAASTFACGYVDSFIVVVKDGKTGVPLNNVNVTIFNSLAEPNSYVIQLYDGNPNDGGSPADSPMTLTTDKNGAVTIYFEYCGGGGVEYKSDFQVSSGSINERVEFEVTSEEETT